MEIQLKIFTLCALVFVASAKTRIQRDVLSSNIEEIGIQVGGINNNYDYVLPDYYSYQYGSDDSMGSHADEDNLILHLLTEPNAPTCNDGSQAGFYVKRNTESNKWVIYLQGGWYCYDEESCKARYKFTPNLMSSRLWEKGIAGSGIYSPLKSENPHLYSANLVYVPYCSSDLWSGSANAGKVGKYNLNFMGHDIITEVFKKLSRDFGMINSSSILLAGSSAGGIGVFVNADHLQEVLEEEGGSAKIRTVVDSAWYLLRPEMDNDVACISMSSCSPVASLRRGMKLWGAILPQSCEIQTSLVATNDIHARAQVDNRWKCFFGQTLYPHIKSPVYIVQWMFDEAQLLYDKVDILNTDTYNRRHHLWRYMQHLVRDFKASLKSVDAVFAPSCVAHTVLENRDWTSTMMSGIRLPDAINCWEEFVEDKMNKITHKNRRDHSNNTNSRKIISHDLRSRLLENRRIKKTRTSEKLFQNSEVDNSDSETFNLKENLITSSNEIPQKLSPKCNLRLIDNCPFPHCNPSCPPIYLPSTGRQLQATDLMLMLGFDVAEIANNMGFEDPWVLLQILSDG